MLIFGDLNFRLEMDNGQCRQMIKDGNLSDLTTHDQFLKTRETNNHFSDLEEGELSFDPTYKFNFNTNDYDTSKKIRVPAWCDRIIWKKSPYITQNFYNSVDYSYSDHKPVYAIFRINTIDHQKASDKSQSCRNLNKRETFGLTDDSISILILDSYVYTKRPPNPLSSKLIRIKEIGVNDEYSQSNYQTDNGIIIMENTTELEQYSSQKNTNSSLNFLEDNISKPGKIKKKIEFLKESITVNEEFSPSNLNFKKVLHPIIVLF